MFKNLRSKRTHLKIKTYSFKYIIVFTVLIKILIIRTDKSVFFKSMLRYVKRVTHWKPTQKFKFKFINIFKSYSQHNHQVYFRNKFFFNTSKLYFIFATQLFICAVQYSCRIYRTVLIFVFNEPFTHIYISFLFRIRGDTI